MNRLVQLLFALSFASSVQAQSTPLGPVRYGSLQTGGFEAVNRQNLNAFFDIPIANSLARGTPFNFGLEYNTLFWTPSGTGWLPVTDASGNPTWGWNKDQLVGSTKYSHLMKICNLGTKTDPFFVQLDHYFGYSYVDTNAVSHSFGLDFWLTPDPTDCGITGGGNQTAYAGDNSGYYLDATSPESPTVWSRNGVNVTSAGVVTDRNGNFVSKVIVSSTETDWKDTVGRVALKIITSPSSTAYQYLDPTGNYQTTTVNYQTFNIKTAFGCSGRVEYTGPASLPVSIVLPNQQQYTLSYEPTSGQTGYYTGRLLQITLPGGGSYQYQYTGTNGGINCADGSGLNLTRTVNDGTSSFVWQYSRVPSGTSGGTTTVTAPTLPYDSAANQTVFVFDTNGHETSQKVYQGTAASGTLLRTLLTTWASNATPATRTVILDDNTTQAEIETTIDSYGNLLSQKEHDWGTGSPGSVLRTTSHAYLSTSAYAAKHLLNLLSTQTIAAGLGNVKFRMDIAYDQSTLTCVTGVAQHDDTNYGCSFTTRGNPTSTTTYTDPSTLSGPITKNSTYDSLGNLLTADVDCCQRKQWTFSSATQYAFADSVKTGASGGPQLTSSATYNPSTGLVATSTDENGKLTTYAYDNFKRLLSVTRPDSAQVTYTYNDTQKSVAVSSPVQGTSKRVQTNYSNGLGRVTKSTISDASGTTYSITETRYDPMGRPYKTSNPHNSTALYWTEKRYDALARIRAVVLQDGSQSSWTYSANSVTATDPSGKQRKSQSDGLGRVTSVFEPDVNHANALTQLTSYQYNLMDDLWAVTQGAQTRSYSYDGLRRLISLTTPEAGTVSYQYNSFGLMTQRTDARGVITTYTFDTLNRLTNISYNVGSTGVPPTPSVTLTYGTDSTQNNNGRLIQAADGTGSEVYSYDPNLPRITQLQKVISGTTYPLTFGYNLAGQLSSFTYPSGRVLQKNYDSLGRLNSIASGTTNFVSGYAYSPPGEVTGFNYGNGVTANLGFSQDRLQLTSLAYSKGTQTLFSLTYGYTQASGNDGEVTTVADLVDSGRGATYTYDALGRLSTAITQGSAGYPKWGLSWTYDPYGNRTAQSILAGCVAPMTCPTNSVSIDATKNRITGSPYAYDLSGNMTNDGMNTLTFDGENRVVSSAGSLGSGTYAYDAKSLRVTKVSGGTTTVYIYAGDKVIAEYSGTSVPYPLAREYIYSGSGLVATIEGGITKYHHPDHLSTRLTTDSSGNVLGQQGHFTFGEVWYSTNTTTKWQFATYERDAESGNDYALQRFNVNRLGRFSSPDPSSGSSSDPQSLNRYSYSKSDPIDLVDPTGLYPQDQHEFITFMMAGMLDFPDPEYVADGAADADNFYNATTGLFYLGGYILNFSKHFGVPCTETKGGDSCPDGTQGAKGAYALGFKLHLVEDNGMGGPHRYYSDLSFGHRLASSLRHIWDNIFGRSPDTDPANSHGFCDAWTEMAHQINSGAGCPQQLITDVVTTLDVNGLKIVGETITKPDGSTLNRGDTNIDGADLVDSFEQNGWTVNVWQLPGTYNFYDDPNVQNILNTTCNGLFGGTEEACGEALYEYEFGLGGGGGGGPTLYSCDALCRL